jgi:hypothetical protein
MDRLRLILVRALPRRPAARLATLANRITMKVLFLLLAGASAAAAQNTVENYILEYPNQEQVRMMTAWLARHEPGTFSFTGLVDPADATVITPQATVNYGYNWFSLAEGPAIITTPTYDRFFSVSIFDMKHNVPAVVVNPDGPILLTRPGQERPTGDFAAVVELETDQGLAFTRMVVVDNLDDVMALSTEIVMEGGRGNMHRPVQRFSEDVRRRAERVIEAMVAVADPDETFGRRSGDVGMLSLAAGVMQGQLGTPPDTVRYVVVLADATGAPLSGDATYEVTVPAGIVKADGYFSVTVYGTDNKLLIPNAQKRYDRTTYTAEQNADGTYTVTLSPDGAGKNGIPTGKDFYMVTRAYVPVPGADNQPIVVRK